MFNTTVAAQPALETAAQPALETAWETAWETTRRMYVSAWRTINSSLDTVFYDVGALTTEERVLLGAHVEPEGSVVVVYPGAAGVRILELTPRAFVDMQRIPGADPVEAVVVAGVGSTAIGTAALARNVADALGRPVAGIVSGYGLSDVFTEAMGGWFVFGARNAMRQAYARLLAATGLPDHVRDDETHADVRAELANTDVLDHFLYGSPDSTTLLYLLMTLGPGIKLLVGHGKGNLSIENALEGVLSSPARVDAAADAVVDAAADAVVDAAVEAAVHRDLCIITLGAVLDFPAEFSNVHQFLGDVDLLGMANSRPFVSYQGVPRAWHSLNEALPGHVTVSDVLEQVRPRLTGHTALEIV